MTTYDARRAPGPPPEEFVILPPQENEQQMMARRLSAAFNRETALRRVRLQDTAVQPLPPSNDPKWMALARELIYVGVDDPERFMHAAFTQSIEMDDTLLHGPQANGFGVKGLPAQLTNYKRYCQRADTALEEIWRADTIQFELAVADMRAKFPQKASKGLWDLVLASPWRCQVSPLFKYCIAASEKLTAILEATHDEALQQLLGDPQGYLRVWKARIPEALGQEAFAQL